MRSQDKSNNDSKQLRRSGNARADKDSAHRKIAELHNCLVNDPSIPSTLYPFAFPEAAPLLDGAGAYYVGGSFLTHGTQSALELAQKAAGASKAPRAPRAGDASTASHQREDWESRLRQLRAKHRPRYWLAPPPAEEGPEVESRQTVYSDDTSFVTRCFRRIMFRGHPLTMNV